ncbi:MAG: FeoC-like transcriptional regulator [Anaerolineae bacterium]
MLEQLLRELAAGSPLHLDELAARLGVTSQLLTAMLEDLERMGYVKAIHASCGSACAGCAYHGLCQLVGGGRIWTLTEAGERAAAK